eukprot:CAMPEP_0194442148 /NCGR_PEP_ID=MMETSP0176-20130528/125282_1 /TAXON_ID=216777 /ORGANISM="Proboscia alata, Strain PI-D3" /LENGTH=543 /DNA_ID=CAMNT_0039268081 /DNA_START=387 /DNA_END=2015 /DNA_ORIENTATION=+
MDLGISIPIAISALRTCVQLSILGVILHPIFILGEHYWILVLLYVTFMITIASNVSFGRTKYYFRGMFWMIFTCVLTNVALVSAIAFGLIIKPDPIWDPQYVIPIVGMLLGNCINGTALCMNGMLTSLVERQHEIELLMSFGATSFEASNRLLREAVHSGTMPLINNMTVIGLVSIPGMMTGQILGGSPVVEAARYQMLIMYLMATCTFGSILMELRIVLIVAFDSKNQMLRVDRFIKRVNRKRSQFNVLFEHLISLCRKRTSVDETNESVSELERLETSKGTDYQSTHSYESSKVELIVRPLTCNVVSSSTLESQSLLSVRGIKRSLPITAVNSQRRQEKRVLFNNLTFDGNPNQFILVYGPSGTGKSELLRVIADLSPLEEGDIYLSGKSRSLFTDSSTWRQNVRYISQQNLSIPGTPRDFINRITKFKSWSKSCIEQRISPALDKFIVDATGLMRSLGLDAECIDKEWSRLSGGESQRVIVALSLSSKPKVLMFDEMTSALDLKSKIRVEECVRHFAKRFGICVIWVTHDVDQIERMSNW